MDDLAGYERRFRRAGLPLFIEDYSATRDIFNRSVPLLGLVFLGEMTLAVDKNWSTLANVGAIAGGLGDPARRRRAGQPVRGPSLPRACPSASGARSWRCS